MRAPCPGRCRASPGSACGHSSGAHLAEDFAYVETIDPDTGRAVPEGEWGRHVITTFGKDGMLLRYDLEELCRLFPRAPLVTLLHVRGSVSPLIEDRPDGGLRISRAMSWSAVKPDA